MSVVKHSSFSRAKIKRRRTKPSLLVRLASETPIASGAYGQVFPVQLDKDAKQEPNLVAKIVKDKRQYHREKIALMIVPDKSDTIVKLIRGAKLVNRSKGTHYIILEKLDQTLLEVIERGTLLYTLDDIQSWIKCILTGLFTLHSLGFVHGDLSPRNVMLVSGQPSKCKLIDLNFAFRIGARTDQTLTSVWYRCPNELLRQWLYDTKQVDASIDLWSVGCILVFLLTRTVPFCGDADRYKMDTKNFLSEPDQGDYELATLIAILNRLGIPSNLECPILSKVLDMLRVNSNDRGRHCLVHLDRVCEDISRRRTRDTFWNDLPVLKRFVDDEKRLEQAKDLVKQLLTFDLGQRPTAEAALRHPFVVGHDKGQMDKPVSPAVAAIRTSKVDDAVVLPGQVPA